jgi:hypothetical protein
MCQGSFLENRNLAVDSNPKFITFVQPMKPDRGMVLIDERMQIDSSDEQL